MSSNFIIVATCATSLSLDTSWDQSVSSFMAIWYGRGKIVRVQKEERER